MTHHQIRQKYPKFVFEKSEYQVSDGQLDINYFYSIEPDHRFTHKLSIKLPSLKNCETEKLDNLIFSLGLAEAASYWKTTCSPTIELTTHNLQLTTKQVNFWHKLYLNGFSQYFYQNQIDYTAKDFLIFESEGQIMPTNDYRMPINDQVLLPLGGGKDSIVTAELLKPHYSLRPIIVYPTTVASQKISQMLTDTPPITVHRQFDPHLFDMNREGYLNGHVPYSAILAFIFALVAQIENIPYIAVSNERSSEEANLTYLGRPVNHQYSKSLEFEKDFNDYLKTIDQRPATNDYFSFLRPLYELQIAKLFSQMPQYFDVFKSCNVGQKENRWCGACPKCLSIAMTLQPWTDQVVIQKIFGGTNPLTNPDNNQILKEMTDPQLVKPFECITTTEEAQVCLEFIAKGQTQKVKQFLSQWGPSHMPKEFENILKNAITPPSPLKLGGR